MQSLFDTKIEMTQIETLFETFEIPKMTIKEVYGDKKPSQLKGLKPFKTVKKSSTFSFYEDLNGDLWIDDYLHKPIQFHLFRNSNFLRKGLDNPYDFLTQFLKQFEFSNANIEFEFMQRYQNGIVAYFNNKK